MFLPDEVRLLQIPVKLQSSRAELAGQGVILAAEAEGYAQLRVKERRNGSVRCQTAVLVLLITKSAQLPCVSTLLSAQFHAG